MTESQFRRIETLIERGNRWVAIKDGILLVSLAGLVFWNVYCQRDIGMIRSEMAESTRELRRIIAMQRADPKAFPQIDKQFEAIEKHERARTSGNRMR